MAPRSVNFSALSVKFSQDLPQPQRIANEALRDGGIDL